MYDILTAYCIGESVFPIYFISCALDQGWRFFRTAEYCSEETSRPGGNFASAEEWDKISFVDKLISYVGGVDCKASYKVSPWNMKVMLLEDWLYLKKWVQDFCPNGTNQEFQNIVNYQSQKIQKWECIKSEKLFYFLSPS